MYRIHRKIPDSFQGDFEFLFKKYILEEFLLIKISYILFTNKISNISMTFTNKISNISMKISYFSI